MNSNPSTTHPVGQTELARLANVSQKTVSRALGDGVGVSPRTRQRIARIAARHQYRPNAAARSTRNGRLGAIGLLLGAKDGRSTLPEGLLNGIQDALHSHSLNLMVVRLDDEQLTDTDHVPRILGEAHCDGLLIDYTHAFPPRMRQLINDYGIPAVWINSKQDHACVRPDDLAAGREAAQHLIDLGHRRIAWADFTHGPEFGEAHYSATDRREGYAAAMVEAGLEPWTIYPDRGESVDRGARAAFAAEHLRRADRPTAVIGYSETTTIPFRVAAAELGLKFPDDLSMITFGDWPVGHAGPLFTSLILPHRTIGRLAVQQLLARLDERQDQPAIAVPFSFEPGKTTTPIRV